MGSVVASALDTLPAAPSDFSHYADQARVRSHMMADYTALLKLGMAVEGRFPQPCAFRYRDDQHAQAICVQPDVATAWQSLTLLGRWELEGISPPTSWLDLSKESLHMARKGILPCVDAKFKAVNKNCRFQRGTSLFLHLYKDLQKASLALSVETRRVHPILVVDVTCWSGDSLEALLQTVVDAKQQGSSEPASPGLYGLFFDKKDVHYQVTRLRRDIFIKSHFVRQALPLHGEQADPSEELIALRKKVAGDALSLRVLGVSERDGTPSLIIPTPLSLPFAVSASLKRRLDTLREGYSKKPRRADADILMVPSSLTIEELRSDYVVLEERSHVISGTSVSVFQTCVKHGESAGALVSEEDGADINDVRPGGRAQDHGPYYFYVANTSDNKITLPAHGVVTRGPAGTFYNCLLAEHEELLGTLPSGTVRWAWSLTSKSLFRFGGQGVGPFATMYDAFRATTGQSDMRLYAHSVCDVAVRGSVARRVPRVHPVKGASICMVLQPAASSVFRAEEFGHLFLSEHVVEEGGLVRLAWPVGANEPGQVAPTTGEPTEWVLAKKTCIDPGQAILITSARN